MGEQVFMFVRHEDAPAFLELGWRNHNSLDGCSHGHWSTLMEWSGEGEPVYPPGHKCNQEKAA